MAINTKTYLTRSNTIVKDTTINLSLNPILELQYGQLLTRGLIYFDHTKIQQMVDDKIYPDISKLKHVLHMTNSASVNDMKINCKMGGSEHILDKQRAISFDLIFFLIPNAWDDGRGFDYAKDLYNMPHRTLSNDACSWMRYKNYCYWDNEGIYTTSQLSKELDLYTLPGGSESDIIIGYQHFEYGNEPITLDITKTVNEFITGQRCNYGIGIAFSPKFEETTTELTQYVGFFTQHTNSFYEPYVETTYDDFINDDRVNFYLNKPNKLYFYANVGGKSVNLDEMPIAEVNGIEYEAKQTTKGAYYIDIELSSDEYEEDTMYYDVWKNLKYKGKTIKDVELSFTTKPSQQYYNFGLPSDNSSPKFIPYLYGIQQRERIKQGDIRKIGVECKIPYTSDQLYAVDNMEYRVYTKNGMEQIDVISYAPIERVYNTNYFLINTSDFIPAMYFIDIKVTYDNEILYHKDVLEFEIINDVTQAYN